MQRVKSSGGLNPLCSLHAGSPKRAGFLLRCQRALPELGAVALAADGTLQQQHGVPQVSASGLPRGSSMRSLSRGGMQRRGAGAQGPPHLVPRVFQSWGALRRVEGDLGSQTWDFSPPPVLLKSFWEIWCCSGSPTEHILGLALEYIPLRREGHPLL